MNDQKIKCKVKACKYNSQGCNCDLDSITVVPESDCPTAHFCGDYCKKRITEILPERAEILRPFYLTKSLRGFKIELQKTNTKVEV